MYGRYHAFLFPSLHDAGPTVVLESLARGLPVICLALGGTAKLVDPTCGCVVSVGGRSEDECVALIGSEIVALATNEARRLALSRGAIERSCNFLWPKTVARFYREIYSRLQRRGSEASFVAQYTPENFLTRAGKWSS